MAQPACQIEFPAKLLGSGAHVRDALASIALIWVEPGSVILDSEFDLPVRGTKRHQDAASARVPADVRQRLLSGPQNRFVGSRGKSLGRRKGAELEIHSGACSEPKCLALLLQRFHEAGVLERHCP